jgi:hypothetical protein
MTPELWGEDGQEFSCPEDGDAPIAPDGQEVVISSYEIVGTHGCGAPQERVVVWVTAHSRARRMRKGQGILAQQKQKCLSIPGGDGILFLDLGTPQDLRHLVDLPWGQEQQKGPSAAAGVPGC